MDRMLGGGLPGGVIGRSSALTVGMPGGWAYRQVPGPFIALYAHVLPSQLKHGRDEGIEDDDEEPRMAATKAPAAFMTSLCSCDSYCKCGPLSA